MPLNGEPRPDSGWPVALTTVTVDGKCRERSPVDLATFGAGAERLLDRFEARDEGQALFLRATGEGAAEGLAMMVTEAGTFPFRISLWRQRGGDKIRILAAFSRCAEGEAAPPPAPAHADGAGELLHLPVNAILDLAERLHLAADPAVAKDANDLLAASWRLRNLADMARRGDAPADPMTEVDLGRIVQRAVRLAGAAHARAEIAIRMSTPYPAPMPLVIGSTAALWSLIDQLILAAAGSGRGPGEVAVAIAYPDVGSGLALTVTGDMAPEPGRTQPRLAEAEAIAARHGAVIDTGATTANGFDARVIFPPERCLMAP
ncbi:HAMP domain-containing histidine kinase [Rhodobacteraceae bacterium NNCM2]|nr:HAMP domain-containing histidine kinase [Coraliihabitans acroporae]